MYGRKYINGSVKWLGVPAAFCDTEVAWTENILVPNPRWVDRGGYKRWDLKTRSIPPF